MPASDALGLRSVVQVSLFVRDVDRSVEFYRDVLGLAHLFTFGEMAFFDVNGLRLYLHAVADADWRAGSVVYFLVDDITATYDHLEGRGVKTAGAPHVVYTDAASGTQEWMAFFNDTEGNTLALLSRVPVTR